MPEHWRPGLAPVRAAILLALPPILLGFGLGAAREPLARLASPGSGLCSLGLPAVIVLVARAAFPKPGPAQG